MMKIAPTVLNELAEHFHSIAKSKGFYEVNDLVAQSIEPPGLGLVEAALLQASIARMHSELSEALEAVRHNNPPSEKIPEFSQVEEEFADLLIRLLDCCGCYGFNIGEAVVAKSHYNLNRPFKHGKNS